MTRPALSSTNRCSSARATKLTAEEQSNWKAESAKLEDTIGSIKLAGLPSDAVVRVGGQLMPDVALSSSFRVRAGKYVVEITAPGFKTYTATVTVPNLAYGSLHAAIAPARNSVRISRGKRTRGRTVIATDSDRDRPWAAQPGADVVSALSAAASRVRE